MLVTVHVSDFFVCHASAEATMWLSSESTNMLERDPLRSQVWVFRIDRMLLKDLLTFVCTGVLGEYKYAVEGPPDKAVPHIFPAPHFKPTSPSKRSVGLGTNFGLFSKPLHCKDCPSSAKYSGHMPCWECVQHDFGEKLWSS